jgi:hypothetical protein
VAACFQSRILAGDSSIREYPGDRCQIVTRRSVSWNGSGRKRTKSVTENAAVFAPTPRATITMVVNAKPRARLSVRAV